MLSLLVLSDLRLLIILAVLAYFNYFLYKTIFWKTECSGVGMVICLEWGADLHMFQLMPLADAVSCSSRI